MNTPRKRDVHGHPEADSARLRAQIRDICGRPPCQRSTTTLLSTVGGYEVLKEVAKTATSTVYKARDRRSDQLVALKMLRPYANEETAQRFHREAQCASRLNHPNIVAVLEIIRDHSTSFIVMEYVPGRTLD